MMRFLMLLFCILFLFSDIDLSARSDVVHLFDDSVSKTEPFEKGLIDWTNGFCLGVATEVDLGVGSRERLKSMPNSFSIRNEIRRELIHRARINLLDIILSIRVDSFNFVRDYFEQSSSFRKLFLTEIEKNMEVLPIVFKGTSSVTVSTKYSLYGAGSLESLLYRLDDNVEDVSFDIGMDKSAYEGVIYTSLIIDLRGSYNFVDSVYEQSIFLPDDISLPSSLRDKLYYDRDRKRLVCKGILTLQEKDMLLSLLPSDNYYRSVVESLYTRSKSNERNAYANPSLFPTIYDSEGRKIYFKNVLDIGKRSSVQFVQYTKDPLLFYRVELVGTNPLYTIADKIRGENNSDIVIGAEDSKKLFLHPDTLSNLKKGNIFILID